MAAAWERQSEAVPPDIFFKCHNQTKVTTVFCVLCENVYHKSDFDRRKGARYVTSAMVICEEHNNVKDITSITQDNPRVALNLLRLIKAPLKDNKKKSTNRRTK